MAHGRLPVLGAAVVLAACCLGVRAAETPVSGLQVGETTPAYNVQDVTGLARGGRICYV